MNEPCATTTDSPPASRAWDAWLTPGRFALLLGLLTFVLYPDVLLGTRTFVFRDFGLYSYPVAHHVRESLWRGEIPLWNPLNNCGIPFLAQWSTMALYPPFLFCLLFPLSWSLGVFCLLHLVWGGVGMYLLAHRWTNHRLAAAAAGLVFAFSGLLASCLLWPFYMAAVSWGPFVWLAGARAWRTGGRALIPAALVGALQMLAGIPEIILVTWLLLGALLALDVLEGNTPPARAFGRFALLVLLVTALAAAQLFPFLDFLWHSHRDAGFSQGEWSMPATGWVNFLAPLFQCWKSATGVFMQHGQNVVSSYYQGIGIFVLAVAAAWLVRSRRAWLLAIATVLGVCLAMGSNAPFYAGLREVFPPLGLMRYPVKFVFVTFFTIPLLGALAIQALDAPETLRRRAWRLPIVLASFTVALILAFVLVVGRRAQANADLSAMLQNAAARAVFLPLVLAALWGAFRATTARRQDLFAAFFLLLVWGDLVTHTPLQNPTASRELFDSRLQPLQDLRPAPLPGVARAALTPVALLQFNQRLLPSAFDTYLLERFGLHDDTNLIEGLAKVDGFYSLHLREEREIFRHCLFASSNTVNAPLADFLGVSQVLYPTNEFFAWRSRTNFLPLVTAGQRIVFADKHATLAGLARADFDPRTTVFLPAELAGRISATNAIPGRVTMRNFSAHEITFEVTAAHPTLVVVAQSFYHPWRAYVNGASVELWRANHAYQALPVPAETAQVKLVYEDRAFALGKWLSLLAFAGCGAALLVQRRATAAIPPKA